MKFRHPLVLLLGGLLSASGIGCSAITAVVGDSRPAARNGRDSAGQMVAIARVFENQGRYGQAEVMYRKALKQKPNDPTIRTQLQQLAERRKGKTFASDSVKEAIAQADGASAPKANASSPPMVAIATQKKVSATSGTNLAYVHESADSRQSIPNPGSSAVPGTSKVTRNDSADTSELTVDASSVKTISSTMVQGKPAGGAKAIDTVLTSPVSPAGGFVNSSATRITTVSAEVVSSAAGRDTEAITAEEILAVVDNAADHSELLLRGLRYGDSLEAQCLAATLMGDCRTDNTAIRMALEKAAHSAKDSYLRLAICDSRIQRNEHDASTASCLIDMMENGPMDVRVQACSSLRRFAGSESQAACVKSLETFLESESPDHRAAAAVTLGDFEQLSPTLVTRLISLAHSDSDSEVREAARAATARYEGRLAETAMTLTPMGE